MTTGSSPVPGWYADPFDANQVRWWDGVAWSEHVREFTSPPAAPAHVEPAPVAPVQPAPAVPDFGAPPSASDFEPPARPAPGSGQFEPVAWSISGEAAESFASPAAPPAAPEVSPFVAGPIDPAAAAGSVLPSPGGQVPVEGVGTPPQVGAPSGVAQQASPPFGMPPAASYPGSPISESPIASPGLQFGAPPATGSTYGSGIPAGGLPAPGGGPAGLGEPGAPAAPGSAGSANAPAGEGKSNKTLLVLLIILGVIVVVAAAVWFFVLRKGDAAVVPKSAAVVTASPAPAASAVETAGVAPPCAATVTALTADGTSSTVISRLEAASTNQNLADTAAFFSSVSQQAASVMTSSGQACLEAVKAGQAPAAYGMFIERFNKAVNDGAELAQLGASTPTGVSPENAALLIDDARELTAAQHAVAPAAPPAVAPAG